MNDHVCEYCKSTFSSANALKTHTKTAKYCLILQNASIDTIECEFCEKKFTKHNTYQRHLKICTAFKLDELEKNIKSQENPLQAKVNELEKMLKLKNVEIVKATKRITKLEKINSLQATEITKLKEELHFDRGQIHVYEKVKPTTTKIVNNKNCIVNAKIASIPITTIKPFTIEAISELVPQYTYEHFIKKVHGMLEILIPFTTLNIDGVIERNIVCTDLSRTVCHLLSSDRVWSIDNGLTISSQIIKLFIPSMKIYFQELNANFLEVLAKVSAEEGRLHKSDYYEHNKNNMERALEMLEDVKEFFYAALLEKSEEHTILVRNFRDLLKPEIHIKAIKG